MRHTEPKVYLIGQTQLNMKGTDQWLSDIGAGDYELKDISDAENLIMVAAKRCYMSFEPGLNPNVTKVRDDATDYLTNILKVGHGSVLEHASFSFAIENVSRVFTGEMNRHRAGHAISEGSMRYIRFTDIPYWVPFSIQAEHGDSEDVKIKKAKTRESFEKVFKFVEKEYTYLVEEIWDMDNLPDFKSKKQLTSALRRIIPMGVSTGGVWTGNIRALRHMFTMRCDAAAEEEIQFVAIQMLGQMMQSCPVIFGDFHVNEKGFWGPEYRKV